MAPSATMGKTRKSAIEAHSPRNSANENQKPDSRQRDAASQSQMMPAVITTNTKVYMPMNTVIPAQTPANPAKRRRSSSKAR